MLRFRWSNASLSEAFGSYGSNSFVFAGSLTNLQLFAPHRIILLPCRECLEASLALLLEKVCTKPTFPSLWNTHPQTCLQENATSQSPLRGNFGSDQRRAISLAFLPFSETLVMRSEENIFFLPDSPPYSAMKTQRTPALTRRYTKPAFYLSAVRTQKA